MFVDIVKNVGHSRAGNQYLVRPQLPLILAEDQKQLCREEYLVPSANIS